MEKGSLGNDPFLYILTEFILIQAQQAKQWAEKQWGQIYPPVCIHSTGRLATPYIMDDVCCQLPINDGMAGFIKTLNIPGMNIFRYNALRIRRISGANLRREG